jgi:hypothetical protein
LALPLLAMASLSHGFAPSSHGFFLPWLCLF